MLSSFSISDDRGFSTHTCVVTGSNFKNDYEAGKVYGRGGKLARWITHSYTGKLTFSEKHLEPLIKKLLKTLKPSSLLICRTS